MFTDLRIALSEDPPPENSRLSDELLSMFMSEDDMDPNNPYKRFCLASKLYQDVMRNQRFDHTVFYKLGEKEDSVTIFL